jgi:hypothetical protein
VHSTWGILEQAEDVEVACFGEQDASGQRLSQASRYRYVQVQTSTMLYRDGKMRSSCCICLTRQHVIIEGRYMYVFTRDEHEPKLSKR